MQLVQNEQAQRENLPHTAKQVIKGEDFSSSCFREDCCGGEFFAGKAGFFATQGGRSTPVHVSVPC